MLDIGCGDALFFDQLTALGEVWGVEPDADLVNDDGPHRHRIHVGPLDATFQPGRRFRLVLLLDVLEHLDDPVGALRQVQALLEPDGRVMITVPAFAVLWTQHDDLNQHRVRYRKDTLARVVEQAGLQVLSARYLFQWLFPAKLVTRAVERSLHRPAKPAGVPPAWINRMLLDFSRLEEASLGRLRPPFGSSLLMWCAPR